MTRHLLVGAIAAVAMAAGAPSTALAAKPPPATWDDLVVVKSTKLDAVYLLPGADFRPYTKVMLDPTEVAFRKNWVRDYNSQTTGLSGRISEEDAQKGLERARTGFQEIFAKAYTDAGYQVVTSPGPDVLRVRTAVINLSVSAPDVRTMGRSRTYAQEAGEATLVLEARDSMSGAILGRAVDRRLAGDTGAWLRNSVTNQSDFSRLFRDWAKISANGLAQLKARSPFTTAAATPQP